MNAIQGIIKKHCNYKTINKDKVKMRNIKKGINLLSALTYRFMYTFLGTTQDSITSSLNNDNSASFSREAYYAKEDNIQVDVYIPVWLPGTSVSSSLFQNFKMFVFSSPFQNFKMSVYLKNIHFL